MSLSTAGIVRPSLPLPAAALLVLGMALFYTALDWSQPAEPWRSLLAFVPGILSTVALTAAGLTASERYLQVRPISRRGLLALALVFILLLPILGSSIGWVGWSWTAALIVAPASGIAQELYFRASLLPLLQRTFHDHQIAALLVHAAIFTGFHLRTFAALPALLIGLLVAAVLFSGGCAWGWQVQKDRTVVWAMAQHTLFLMLMSLFDW